METGFQFRNVFNQEIIKKFAKRLSHACSSFDEKGFLDSILPKLDDLQYGERSALITESLYQFLPKSFPQAVEILLNALEPELEQNDLSGYNGFIIIPQTRYVSKYGLEHYDLSMNALFEMTKRFSAEGDLGYFLELEPEKTLNILKTWAQDSNCHVRRLVSEGTRPRLPLGRRLKMFQKDPRPVIELLELLKDDPELYVRRSVANNLNDIAKDNPHIVVDTLKQWKKINNKGTQWITSHAARTLVKQGNKEALELLGYTLSPQIEISPINLIPQNVRMGQELTFNFTIESKHDSTQNLMIDYLVHFVKANGKTAPKVFKISKKQIKPFERISIVKKHKFMPLTTRKFYSGVHAVELLINGDKFHKTPFHLENKSIFNY